jgi:hypothetical protein
MRYTGLKGVSVPSSTGHSQGCLRGKQRITSDKFYTRHKIVKLCIRKIKKHLNINHDDLIIEPSAGNGAFISKIKKISSHHKFYDIEPENDEIIKKDFLKLNTKHFQKYSQIHIIGNPPFGRQSSLAIRFIKKSCQFCNSISFILPKSFKKESMKKKFPLNFHLIHEQDLPEKSFRIDGKKCDVPCIFQIWERRESEREVPKNLVPKNFKFVKKEDEPDISFRRVGIYAGKIDTNIKNKSIQSHYFIKFLKSNHIKNIIKKLHNVKFECNNTVGPKSISKQELIKKYNKILR